MSEKVPVPRTLSAEQAREIRKRLPGAMLRMDQEIAIPVPPYRALSTGPCDFKGIPNCACGGQV